MITNIACIAIGSAFGGISRYGLSKLLNPIFINLPLGTFSVNVLGCFILGFINALALKNSPFSPAIHLALTTGFCGSFTTFSTFICESAKIAEQGKFSSILYACLSLVFGFLAFFLANQIVKKFM